MGTIAMVLVMAFGHTPLPDHVKFIPVYAMGSTFLTAAWPALFESIGLPLMTMDDRADLSLGRQSYVLVPTVPMSEVVVDFEDAGTDEDDALDATSTRSPAPDWLHERDRRSSSPVPVSTPPTSEGQDTQPAMEPALQPATEHQELCHMGPPSNYSGVSSHTGTSLSLGSQGRCPSEMSSNVVQFFSSQIASRHVRSTQRIRDIQSLGYHIRAPRDGGARDTSTAILIDTVPCRALSA